MIDPLGPRMSPSLPLLPGAGGWHDGGRGAPAPAHARGRDPLSVSPEDLRSRLARAREVTQAVLELLRATREEAGAALARTGAALEAAGGSAGSAPPADSRPGSEASGPGSSDEQQEEARRARREHAARLRELLGTATEPLLRGRIASLRSLSAAVASTSRAVQDEGPSLGRAQGAVRPAEAHRLLAPLTPRARR